MRRAQPQSGQVMVLVAVSLVALIGSAALVLLAGSAEWQKNQLQQSLAFPETGRSETPERSGARDRIVHGEAHVRKSG